MKTHKGITGVTLTLEEAEAVMKLIGCTNSTTRIRFLDDGGEQNPQKTDLLLSYIYQQWRKEKDEEKK